MKMLVLGHGYSAGYLTPRLVAEGWHVSGTTRSDPDRVARAGAEPLLWPGAADTIRARIKDADAILVAAAPGPQGDPVLAAFGDALAGARPAWLGYLSTTGVYGDRGGDWVDETAPLAPSTERGRQRVAAEAAWQVLAARHRLPLHIFRLAGIYGPTRGPFAKLRAGTARRIVKPGQIFSRIHVEDIATILLASIKAPTAHAANAPAIYNLCDDAPAPPEDVIGYAATLLGQVPPPAEDYATAEMTPMARSFYAESKRVSNLRVKRALNITLRYGDYRAGLRALCAADD